MNNFYKAILASLIIHLALFYFFKQELQKHKFEIKTAYQSDKKTSNIHYVKFVPKQVKQQNPQQKQKHTAKKIKKIATPIKPLVKKEQKNKLLKEVKLREKPKIKKSKPFEIPKKESLESFLSQSDKQDNQDNIDEETKRYIKLYGAEFESYPQNIKQYLISNLSKIAQITQSYLRYPPIAAKLKLHGNNIIEFILHPNGDITDVKLLLSSFHESLDENTIRTIEIAYKDYPRPLEATKIRIIVSYIYRY
jgi:protein TonB